MRDLLFCTNDRSLRRAMQEVCAGEGYRMKLCERGMEVLQALSVLMVDLVVLDGGAPGCGTPFLLEAIHRVTPGLPVVVVTTGALGSEGDFRRHGLVPHEVSVDAPETLRHVIHHGRESVVRDGRSQ